VRVDFVHSFSVWLRNGHQRLRARTRARCRV
jgi:hypothetical protein